jgi:hypothetical protein
MSLFHPFIVIAWRLLSVDPRNLQSIIFYDRCSMLNCFFELISSLKRNRDCRNYNKQSWRVIVKLGRSSGRVLFLSNFKQILVKFQNTKCHEYRSISSWQTGGQTDMTNLIAFFVNFFRTHQLSWLEILDIIHRLFLLYTARSECLPHFSSGMLNRSCFRIAVAMWNKQWCRTKYNIIFTISTNKYIQ